MKRRLIYLMSLLALSLSVNCRDVRADNPDDILDDEAPVPSKNLFDDEINAADETVAPQPLVTATPAPAKEEVKEDSNAVKDIPKDVPLDPLPTDIVPPVDTGTKATEQQRIDKLVDSATEVITKPKEESKTGKTPHAIVTFPVAKGGDKNVPKKPAPKSAVAKPTPVKSTTPVLTNPTPKKAPVKPKAKPTPKPKPVKQAPVKSDADVQKDEGSTKPLSSFELGRYQYCGDDRDCVAAVNGCCDCANGSEDVAVNVERLSAFRARFACLHVSCSQKASEPPCGSGLVSCVNHKCKYFLNTGEEKF